MMAELHSGRPFQITHVGRSWAGEWHAAGGAIHVSSAYGSASRKGGANAGLRTAEKMLRELVDAWRRT